MKPYINQSLLLWPQPLAPGVSQDGTIRRVFDGGVIITLGPSEVGFAYNVPIERESVMGRGSILIPPGMHPCLSLSNHNMGRPLSPRPPLASQNTVSALEPRGCSRQFPLSSSVEGWKRLEIQKWSTAAKVWQSPEKSGHRVLLGKSQKFHESPDTANSFRLGWGHPVGVLLRS